MESYIRKTLNSHLTGVVILTLALSACGSRKDNGGSVDATIAIDAMAVSPPPTIGTSDMRTYHEIEIDGVTLPYALVLPESFDSTKTYPILLALPPGTQGKELADAVLDLYWDEKARELGWIVISPMATSLGTYDSGSEVLIKPFLERLAAVYRPENGKYHIAGASIGGLSSFRIAGQNPELFSSLLVLPGFASSATDISNLSKLANIPVSMFVGEQDAQPWIQGSEATKSELENVGGTVTLDIRPMEGHLIRSISSDDLFAIFDDAR